MKKLLAVLLTSVLAGCSGGLQNQALSLEQINMIYCDGEGYRRLSELPDHIIGICNNEARTRINLERHH